MRNSLAVGLCVALTSGLPVQALAQQPTAVPFTAVSAGTRLDIVATGEVARVPDVAIISAGVVTRAQTATAAIADNAARMERVRAALRRAGIADRDIQTSSVNLNPDYQYAQNQPPRLTGYQASNNVSIRFREIRRTGAILDALVAEGANQLNGPALTIDKPQAALDEARVLAISVGRARADVYARALGMRVVRLISISEAGADQPRPMMTMDASEIRVTGSRVAKTDIDPGEQKVSSSVSMSFELR
jgi:uncharacterized protein YggE